MCELDSPEDPKDPKEEESSPILELDELVEPLDTDTLAPSEPLAADDMVTSPSGKSFRIAALLKTETPFNLYEVILNEFNKDARTVWLREASNETAAERLRHEAEILKELNCPMFPQLIECFEFDSKTYLATEPIPTATTLADLLASEKASLSSILSVLSQVAFALIQLHAHGWSHLGIRPNVIALSKPVKISDFSYATRLGEKPAAPFYHTGYSPPELLTEEPIDARADIYAVGALLFHAINGKPLAETGAELSSWEPPTPIAGVPQIIHRCLGPREMRYAAMEKLHRDLLGLARRCAPTVSYSVAAATTIGLEPTRTTNQDAQAYLTGHLEFEASSQDWTVLCVADGMGGMESGEIASEVAVKTVLSEAASTFAGCRSISAEEQVQMVKKWAQAANAKVCAALEAHQARGGTTLICACVVNRRLTMAHVGDCRLYLIQKGEISLLSRDHSLAMAFVLQGEISMAELRQHPDRSKISRSLGERQPLPDYFVDTLEAVTGSETLELYSGDALLLCSDGLWEPVTEEDMLKAINSTASNLKAAADDLLKIALQRGAPDNATLVLLRVDDPS